MNLESKMGIGHARRDRCPSSRWGSCIGTLTAAVGVVTSFPLAVGADVRWKASGDATAVYTDNVYYEDKNSNTDSVSATGGSVSGGIGLDGATPRSEFALGYKASYRNFPRETRANNLEQYLTLSWNTFASPSTAFSVSETASRSPEADNFEDRGVDQGLTVGARARQVRSTTALGMTNKLSPRWSFRADYAYRLLNNGRIERPEGAPPSGLECSPGGGGFCIPLPLPDLNGDGTPDTPAPAIENLALLDETGHTVSLGISHALSESTQLTASGTYVTNRSSDDLFGGTTLHKANSTGVNIVYAWRRVKTGLHIPPEETEGPVDVQTPLRRPSEDQPVAPLSAGTEGRPRGGISAARAAARRAAGPDAGRVFALPTDTLDAWVGVGAYRVQDEYAREIVDVFGTPDDRKRSSTEYSAELGVIRTYGRGSLSAGLTRGVSTFEGLGRLSSVHVNQDVNHDGTLDEADQEAIVVPLGAAVRTTLYGSYVFTLSRVSYMDASINGTRRESVERELDGVRAVVTAVGAGIGYDLQFANWGGLRASYRYTRQRAPGDQLLSDREFDSQTAFLGFFFSTR